MRTIKVGLVSAVLAVMAAWMPSPASAQAQGEIVFVESQRILQAAPGARDAQQTLEQEIGALREQVQEMEQTLDSLVTAYDQRQVMLSPEAKRQMEEEIRGRQREFQTRAMQLERQAQERQSELLRPIMARVQRVIDELRQERGYAIVLDASEGGIISAAAERDITQEVLNRLQQASVAGQGGGTP